MIFMHHLLHWQSRHQHFDRWSPPYIDDVTFLGEVSPLENTLSEKVFFTKPPKKLFFGQQLVKIPNLAKGWPRSYPGYCQHLWNPPLQSLHHSQQCHCIWNNYNCSCLVFSGIAENDEVVAVEDFIDVGNILGKSWVGPFPHKFNFGH